MVFWKLFWKKFMGVSDALLESTLRKVSPKMWMFCKNAETQPGLRNLGNSARRITLYSRRVCLNLLFLLIFLLDPRFLLSSFGILFYGFCFLLLLIVILVNYLHITEGHKTHMKVLREPNNIRKTHTKDWSA